jgi:hypothetical protein
MDTLLTRCTSHCIPAYRFKYQQFRILEILNKWITPTAESNQVYTGATIISHPGAIQCRFARFLSIARGRTGTASHRYNRRPNTPVFGKAGTADFGSADLSACNGILKVKGFLERVWSALEAVPTLTPSSPEMTTSWSRRLESGY